MAAVTAFLGAAAALLVASPARATPPGGYDAPNYVSYERPPTQRRGGFALGMSMGVGIGRMVGYPNEVAKIGEREFRESTGAAFQNQLAFWLGASPRDWLTFGIGLALISAQGGGIVGSNAGPILHIEAFPFFPKGGPWHSLGIAFDGGLGVGALVDPEQPEELLAGGGATSQLALTVFYEPFQFWQASSGPLLSYAHGFGQTFSSHQVVLGFRLAFYGVQPRRSSSNAEKGATAFLPWSRHRRTVKAVQR